MHQPQVQGTSSCVAGTSNCGSPWLLRYYQTERQYPTPTSTVRSSTVFRWSLIGGPRHGPWEVPLQVPLQPIRPISWLLKLIVLRMKHARTRSFDRPASSILSYPSPWTKSSERGAKMQSQADLHRSRLIASVAATLIALACGTNVGRLPLSSRALPTSGLSASRCAQ